MPFEDRQALLGHTNGSVTTHYSAADLSKLIVGFRAEGRFALPKSPQPKGQGALVISDYDLRALGLAKTEHTDNRQRSLFLRETQLDQGSPK